MTLCIFKWPFVLSEHIAKNIRMTLIVIRMIKKFIWMRYCCIRMSGSKPSIIKLLFKIYSNGFCPHLNEASSLLKTHSEHSHTLSLIRIACCPLFWYPNPHSNLLAIIRIYLNHLNEPKSIWMISQLVL